MVLVLCWVLRSCSCGSFPDGPAERCLALAGGRSVNRPTLNESFHAAYGRRRDAVNHDGRPNGAALTVDSIHT
ncbi:hypothetical protein [Miniimonas arenae]|uniref:hypothetical protein n=1 Tax=Miniimonas arenae TaxID=676201 RepID=UPI0028A5E2CE|nr:hypothetical protein [Miniimonas arenae]